MQQLFNSDDRAIGDRKSSQLFCGIQQLLGDKANAIDGSFFHELFVQHLLLNVRMVLALTNDITSLKTLLVLLTTEVEQLCTEITELKHLVKAFTP